MSYVFPGALVPWIERRFVDAYGVPLALGTISSFQAGTSTPLETYSDSALSVANAVILTLNANGCAPNPMYMLPRAYKFTVKDVNGVVQPHYPFDNIVDVGQVVAEYFGTYAAAGSKSVASGYTTLSTDHFITVLSTGGANPCLINLLAASLAKWPLIIKNIGTIKVRMTPNGLDTLEGANTYLQIPGITGAAGQYQPSVTLMSDGISAWKIVADSGFSVFV